MRLAWRRNNPMVRHQEDSVTIIAAPVSGTRYEWREGETGAGASLGTQRNVRIIGIEIHITWATTQPTPLQSHVTINGNAITYFFNNPVTGTEYYATHGYGQAMASQPLSASVFPKAFLLEGRSVNIECEITWATTQPTNLTMRVKWAQWP